MKKSFRKLDEADDLPFAEWPKLLQVETKIVRSQVEELARDGRELAAQFVGVLPDNGRIVIILEDLMRNERGKDAVASVMQHAVRLGCVAVLFSCESWMTYDYEWKKRNPTKSVEHAPGAREMVMVQHYSKDGDVMASAMISGKGKKRKFGPWKVKKHVQTSGRFTDIWRKAQAENN